MTNGGHFLQLLDSLTTNYLTTTLYSIFWPNSHMAHVSLKWTVSKIKLLNCRSQNKTERPFCGNWLSAIIRIRNSDSECTTMPNRTVIRANSFLDPPISVFWTIPFHFWPFTLYVTQIFWPWFRSSVYIHAQFESKCAQWFEGWLISEKENDMVYNRSKRYV